MNRPLIFLCLRDALFVLLLNEPMRRGESGFKSCKDRTNLVRLIVSRYIDIELCFMLETVLITYVIVNLRSHDQTYVINCEVIWSCEYCLLVKIAAIWDGFWILLVQIAAIWDKTNEFTETRSFLGPGNQAKLWVTCITIICCTFLLRN